MSSAVFGSGILKSSFRDRDLELTERPDRRSGDRLRPRFRESCLPDIKSEFMDFIDKFTEIRTDSTEE